MEHTNRYPIAKTTVGGSFVARAVIALYALIVTLFGVALAASLPF